MNRLRGDGIPVEASAAVLDFDPMDFRRWLADDTVVRFRSDRARNTSAPAAPLDRARRPASNRSGRQPAPSDQMRRAFEGPVRTRAAELMPEPPDDDEGWFPLVRLLAGEGVPVDVSTAILGVDVDAYRFWMTDDRRQISSSVGDSGRPA